MRPGARALSTAVALVAVAALATGWMAGTRRESPRVPVDASRVTAPKAVVAPPDARGILAHAAALDLTAAQQRRLEALDHQWRVLERELLDRLEVAQSHIAEVTASGRPVALRELEQRAAGYSELSTELREARLGHAEDALGVLTAPQALQLREIETTSNRSGGQHDTRN